MIAWESTTGPNSGGTAETSCYFNSKPFEEALTAVAAAVAKTAEEVFAAFATIYEIEGWFEPTDEDAARIEQRRIEAEWRRRWDRRADKRRRRPSSPASTIGAYAGSQGSHVDKNRKTLTERISMTKRTKRRRLRCRLGFHRWIITNSDVEFGEGTQIDWLRCADCDHETWTRRRS